METALPGQFLPALRLLRAVHGNGSERDERVIHLALGHLEPFHREHFLSRAVGANELWELELAHRRDRAYQALTRNSIDALRVVFWKLGIITHPSAGHKWRARRCPLVMGLMDRHLGADPGQTEFACLACGHLLRVPVGKTKKLSCPTCKVPFGLRFNDGRRIAFSRPRPARNSWVSVDCNPFLNPYEVLQVDPTATLDEMRKAYRRQLVQCHPDKVWNLGSPTALWAAEEATRNINEARRLIEQSAAR